MLVDALAVPQNEKVSSIEIIDISGNGFGDDDLMILHPGNRYIWLRDQVISEAAQKILHDIPPPAVSSICLKNLEAALEYDKRIRSPESSIFVTLLSAIQRSSRDTDFMLILIQTPKGISFDLVNFNSDSAEYHLPVTY